MNRCKLSKRVLMGAPSLLVIGLALAALAQSEEPKLAPAGFNNVTNDFTDQEKFDADRKAFEDVETILPEKKSTASTKVNKSRHGRASSGDPAGNANGGEAGGGLGPVYNATSCVSCHQNPVTGSSSQVSEIRAGRLKDTNDDPNNPKSDFVEPPGGSLIHQRAIDAQIQEHVQAEDKVRTLRMSTNILGNGFVEVIPDQELIDNCKAQPEGMRGLPVAVPVAVRKAGAEFQFVLRVGRFGWKDQEASLLNFSANAYINEMGITSPLQPTENKSNGRDVTQFDPVADPEDEAKNDSPFGEDVEAFARFMRSTRVPPRDFAVAQGEICKDPKKDPLTGGEKVFNDIGCTGCHRPQYVTPKKDTPIIPLARREDSIPGTDFGPDDQKGVVPDALANKIICPFSDFLLHDIGTKDGIVQTQHAQLPPLHARRFMQQVPSPFQPKRRSPPAAQPQAQQEPLPRSTPVSVDECTPEIQEYLPQPSQPASTNLESRQANQERVLDQRTRHRVRTAPLWGLRVRPQLLHDGSAFTIEEAILAHKEEARAARMAFEALPEDQKRALLTFLNSL